MGGWRVRLQQPDSQARQVLEWASPSLIAVPKVTTPLEPNPTSDPTHSDKRSSGSKS